MKSYYMNTLGNIGNNSLIKEVLLIYLHFQYYYKFLNYSRIFIIVIKYGHNTLYHKQYEY